ncbi:MAG TPA: DUF3679 domain-containing protein [Candidatus Bathyarchaeia archaeon]|nr:DUF3679 domain-containing protein [Candidatus Bathyarchaeia archaeon]
MNVTVKFIGLVIVLLVGVVIGLQTAERGIYKVEGRPDQLPQTFYIKKVDKGQMEIAVMGTTKQIEGNPAEVTTYVSNFGESMGTMIKNSTRKLIDWLASML